MIMFGFWIDNLGIHSAVVDDGENIPACLLGNNQSNKKTYFVMKSFIAFFPKIHVRAYLSHFFVAMCLHVHLHVSAVRN